MKNVIFKHVAFLMLVMFIMNVGAQVPQGFNYQAVARNSVGSLLQNKPLGVKLSIHQGSPTGTVVYSERHTPSTNQFGLFTVTVGQGLLLNGNFTSITWSSDIFWLQIELDVSGGNTYTDMGTSQLLTVPYAMHSMTADSLNEALVETDPVFIISPASGISLPDIASWNIASGWGNHATAGYLASYTETDPLFLNSPAHGISSPNIVNWSTAYGWGDHATAGYLSHFTEADPYFGSSPASGITVSDISSWNTAFGWGNHANAGYLTSFTESDPIFLASPSNAINYQQISNWNTAYNWGDHANAGYLTQYTETDPLFAGSPVNGINNSDISNWNTAFNWGNHANAGYLTDFTETDPIFGASPAYGISGYAIATWNTAFGWGDHATAGYLTSFTETDPVFIVSVANGINNSDITSWNNAYAWGNHATAGYLTSFTEVDPEVGANTLNYISKWNGSSLVTSSIFDNGYVGIGTITPAEKLDITGNIKVEGANSIIYGNNTGSSGLGNSFAMKLITDGQEKAKIEYLQENAYSTNINFSTRLGTGGFSSVYSEKMRISPAGNVGIGTISPTTKLDVNGVITASGGNSTNWNTAFNWGNHATAGYLISFIETDPGLAIHFDFTGETINDLLHFNGTKWVPFAPNYLTTEAQNLNSVLTNGTDAGNKAIVNVSQQGIGTATPNVSAALEISSTTKGFLPPRMTDLQMMALTPVEGLIIYNTSAKIPVFYNGTEWRKIDGSEFLHIGKSYQGGIIAYILQPGDPGYIAGEVHGLIASPTNLGSNISWGCSGTALPGADGTALGTGNQNTIDIMAACPTAGIAARLCGDLVIGAYSDWYFPSLDETTKLYQSKAVLPDWATYNVYWTSSEMSNFFAWRVNSTIGSPDTNNKNLAGFVRAVRSF